MSSLVAVTPYRTNTVELPDELYLYIFELATDNTPRVIHSLSTHKTFSIPPEYSRDRQVSNDVDCDSEARVTERIYDRSTLPTKRAIFVACKRFRSIVAHLLYEDVWLHRGASALLTTLKRSENGSEIRGSRCVHHYDRESENGARYECECRQGLGRGYGGLVRRIVFPLSCCCRSRLQRNNKLNTKICHCLTTLAKMASHILTLCPNVRVLVRTGITSDHEIMFDRADTSGAGTSSTGSFVDGKLPTGPSLPLLTHVEWDSLYNTPSPLSLLWNLESLESLTLSGNCLTTSESISDAHTMVHAYQHSRALKLSRLRSLCLRSEYAFHPLEPSRVHLPSLTDIILLHPAAITSFIDPSGALSSSALTRQITYLELGCDNTFLHADYVALLLLYYFPCVVELRYEVFSTRSLMKNRVGSIVGGTRVDDDATPGPHFGTIVGEVDDYVEYSVKHVGLYAGLSLEYENDSGNAFSADRDMHGRSESEAGSAYPTSELRWLIAAVNDHFNVLCGPGTRFTKLERITLYGAEWAQFVVLDEFERALERVEARNIELVAEDAGVDRLLDRLKETSSRL